VTLVARFIARAEAAPEHVAVIEPSGARVRYGELEQRSAALAAALKRRGIGRQDRALVALRPGAALYTALAALWRLGAVAVFAEPSTGLAGLRHAARVTRPSLLLGGPSLLAVARLWPELRAIRTRLPPAADPFARSPPIASLSAGDPALVSFTSGTTGAPKAMERSHGLLLAQHEALTPLLAPRAATETDLVAFPAFVLSCLGHGTTAVLPRWNPRRHDHARPDAVSRQIVACGVTRALLPPVVTAALAQKPLPRPLERVLTGGGPVYPDVMRRFLDTSAKVGLTVVYGSTEAEPISHIAMDEAEAAIWDAIDAGGGLPVGHPVPQARVRIVDGEIAVAGPHVNKGYLDPSRDRETKIVDGETVWHRTGDAGRLDGAGRLWLLGRTGALVGGHSPFVVETAARLWPGVRGAALAAANGRAILFVEGDARHRTEWQRRADALGDIGLAVVAHIPMDRRHRSKPDLHRLLGRQRA
jgi:olefin beta-lactone synthetase